MKLLKITLPLSVIGIFAAAMPVSAEIGWYVGGKLGQASGEADVFDFYPVDDNATAYGLKGGVTFSENFALELGYTDYGEFEGRRRFTYATSYEIDTLTAEMSALSLSVLASYPLAENFSLFGRLGLADWDGDADEVAVLYSTATSAEIDRETFGYSDSGVDLVYALGLTWHVADQFALSFEYEIFDAAAEYDDEDVDFDLNSLAFGASFRF